MTTRRLASIAVLSVSIHAAVFFFILAYPVIALVQFFKLFDPERPHLADQVPWLQTWLLMPAALALVGTLLIVFVCLAYNLSARLLGGVRYTVEEKRDGEQEAGE